MRLDELIAQYSGTHSGLHSLSISHGETLKLEWYSHPYRRSAAHMLHSATKSFVGTAVGLAQAEGRLSLDDRLADHVPTRHLVGAKRAAAESLRLRDLLTMRTGHNTGSSGLAWRTIETSWIDEYLSETQPGTPGEDFIYSSGSSHMLSVCVTNAVGQSVHDYLQPRLFDPLGFHGHSWDTDPEGYSSGGNGLSLRTLDLLKWGVLHLQGGVYGAQRLLDAEWVSNATRSWVTASHSTWNGSGYTREPASGGDLEGYGYQIWIHDDLYYASGMFGQYCVVAPNSDLVVAVTAALSRAQSRSFVKDLTSLLHSTPAEELRLSAEAHMRHLPLTAADELAPFLGHFTSEHGHLSLDRRGELLRVSGTGHGGDFEYTAGIEEAYEYRGVMAVGELHHSYTAPETGISAAAHRISSDRLRLTVDFLNAPFTDEITLTLTGDGATLTHSTNVNSAHTELKPLPLRKTTGPALK